MSDQHQQNSTDTILVVEDDPAMCLLIQRILGHDSYESIAAGDGVEAQVTIRSRVNKPSAILLDWQMPRMNGIEFLNWIKKEPEYEHIPVIMVTSMIAPENIKEGIEAGAFYYLTKPMEEQVLRAIVRAAVSDLHQKQMLLDRIKKSDNPFGQLIEGKFRFKRNDEAEFIAVAIANASAAPQKTMVISEILLNAVEHGNLGITYDEKTDLISKNILQQEVARRLALPEYAKKYVELTIKRNNGGLIVEVEDQGAGFDFTKYLQMDESRVFDNHGRGIALCGEYLDLKYLGRGNRVVVTIPGT